MNRNRAKAMLMSGGVTSTRSRCAMLLRFSFPRLIQSPAACLRHGRADTGPIVLGTDTALDYRETDSVRNLFSLTSMR